jgi:hypothetical protein
VYTRTEGIWTEQAKLAASDGAQNDSLGSSVGVSGDTVVAGAPFKNVGGKIFAGNAYVYTNSYLGNRFLTALTPALVWMGHSGLLSPAKYDVHVDVLLNGHRIGGGTVLDVSLGPKPVFFAKLLTIPLSLSQGSVSIQTGDVLSVTVGVSFACGTPSYAGKAILWYDGEDVDTGFGHDTASRFGVTIATETTEYFLRAGFVLSPTPGTSHVSVSTLPGPPCEYYNPLGSWGIALP